MREQKVSERRRVLLWLLAAVAALLLLVVVIVWQHRASEDYWNTFLVGDPHAGSHIFRDKGCSHCHAVNGQGAKRAPDLGFQLQAQAGLNQLAIEMWNHAPLMWTQMEAEGIPYPSFSTRDMANLFAYLYTARYADEPGNTFRGRLLFTAKGCNRCHAMNGTGGAVGPDLTELGPVVTPIFWAQAMWNHAPAMESHMKQMQLAWPRFEDNEMNDLLAYIREARGGPQREYELLPADPRHGWELFQSKGCISCHAVQGEGGTLAPDLGAGKPLPPTLTQVAAQMWNHSPKMWAAMEVQHIPRPTFEGQEMADLLAFLFSLRSYNLGGSSLVGKQLFTERGCGHCHGADGQGGKSAPGLRGRGRVLTPVTLARVLWSHGPRMYRRTRELGLAWPALQESDLGHLLAFLNSPPEETH